MIQIELPYPPSVNHYWRRHGSTYFVAAEGKRYRVDVQAAVLLAGRPRVEGRLAIVVHCWPPDKRRRDLDNLGKALFDSLKAAGVYEDDSQIDDMRLVRMPVVKGGKVVVQIKAAEVAA